MPKKKYVYCWDEVPVVIDVIYASVILGLTAVQVRILLRRGDLKGVKIGRDWRITKSSIMEFIGIESENKSNISSDDKSISKSEATIHDFLQKDIDKLAEIVEKYPFQIPVPVIADWWHCSEDSLRNALKQQGLLGIAQKQPGKVNAGFVIPTGHFVRWYTCKWGM